MRRIWVDFGLLFSLEFLLLKRLDRYDLFEGFEHPWILFKPHNSYMVPQSLKFLKNSKESLLHLFHDQDRHANKILASSPSTPLLHTKERVSVLKLIGENAYIIIDGPSATFKVNFYQVWSPISRLPFDILHWSLSKMGVGSSMKPKSHFQ